MLIYDFESSDLDRWIVCVHGFKGNKNSVKQIVRGLDGFNKLYVQAPIEVSHGEYTWFDKNGDLATGVVEDLKVLLDKFKVNPSQCWWLGFSQGGAVIFRVAQALNIQNICALCSFTSEDLAEDYGGLSLFWYSSLDDQIVPFSKSFGSFQQVVSKFSQSMFVTGSSGHKISSRGLKALAFWVKA